jgi:hypothetical protein
MWVRSGYLRIGSVNGQTSGSLFLQ